MVLAMKGINYLAWAFFNVIAYTNGVLPARTSVLHDNEAGSRVTVSELKRDQCRLKQWRNSHLAVFPIVNMSANYNSFNKTTILGIY